MSVLSDKCKECNLICYTINFQRNFKNWTSGDNEIDKSIRNIQLIAHKDLKKALEWIPYEKFYDVKYIAEDRYVANWIDGYMIDWNNTTQSWKREGRNMSVGLEVLNNPKNITLKFVKKVK
jgi:hypothetical protein